MSGIEVRSNLLTQSNNGQWVLQVPQSHRGGGLFAITADFCSHCQSLKKNVQEAQHRTSFDYFYLDGASQSNKQLLSQMNIEGFPTMYNINRNGILTEYNGGRNVESLAQTFHK